MGRPKSESPVPQAQRSARSRTRQKENGGSRLEVNLSPAGTARLAVVMKQQKFEKKKEAIEWCLKHCTTS